MFFRTWTYCFNAEEKYTWVLSPKDRTGGAGVHFLVMKPVVEPGIKSINATVTVTSIAAQCKYWSETKSTWSEDGCRVSKEATHIQSVCSCTFFKSELLSLNVWVSFFFFHRLAHSPRLWSLSASVTTWLSLAVLSLSCQIWWMCHAPQNFLLHSPTILWLCVSWGPFFLLTSS